MGFGREEIANSFPEPTDESMNLWLENQLSKIDGDISLEKLANGPVLPPDYNEIAFAEMKFKTPSGKIEIINSEQKFIII